MWWIETLEWVFADFQFQFIKTYSKIFLQLTVESDDPYLIVMESVERYATNDRQMKKEAGIGSLYLVSAFLVCS